LDRGDFEPIAWSGLLEGLRSVSDNITDAIRPQRAAVTMLRRQPFPVDQAEE